MPRPASVIVACLDGWAACAGVDRDELITEVRAIVDEHLTGDDTD
jgi:hypothetical protein